MGKKYATLKDVAKLAGTTASTVSYVLSGKEGRYISQDMRQRVMKAVEQTGYVKSQQSEREKKRDHCGIGSSVFKPVFYQNDSGYRGGSGKRRIYFNYLQYI